MTLKEFIREEGTGMATPGNTTGMGNPLAPDGEQPGSEPIISRGYLSRRNLKTKKDKKGMS